MSSHGDCSYSDDPDSEDIMGAVAEVSQSDPNEHSAKEIGSETSSIWYFRGSLNMALGPNGWNDDEIPSLHDMARHFAKDYFKTPPVPITYMHIAMDFLKAI